ncbi:type I inositol polyphosphate 5-phosphatase 8-like [Phoenix dactylifera]|uniref:Type I inositol polyphosphate 5-phosphatase 8-like n=1 Tax=Phoenix dactylifera TaxID=42345 RepID=A0A8B8J088_PHODC|nr:type I inositol polyphosphate 5-phosphatase 8-like [Phoenix dactylifera]
MEHPATIFSLSHFNQQGNITNLSTENSFFDPFFIFLTRAASVFQETMRTETGRNQKSSWPKTVMRKWLNIKTSGDDFHSDYNSGGVGVVQERRKSCSDKDRSIFSSTDLSGSGWLMESSESLKPSPFGPDPPAVASHNIKMFVGTWNVGGRSPRQGELINLKDWLMNTSSPADIYVLGFQEIVPLNTGNILGAEDREPALQWLSLMRQALNNKKKRPFLAHNYTDATQKPRLSFSDLLSMEDQMEEGEEDGEVDRKTSSNVTSCSSDDEDFSEACSLGSGRGGRYCLAAGKQMVGIFLCVWVRADLMQQVTSLKVSCVGRGIMGYMGNKGSISISMTLCHATFCFVCTHLTSGEKDGDETRRNLDVMEILRRTRFPPSHRLSESAAVSPATILGHDKILWLGDLNYRLAAGGAGGDTDELLHKNDWQALLEKDQLHIEQRAGRVFRGWQEGRICFPPTYKYLHNSDRYAVKPAKFGDKRRTPAWCDRILWRGKGMKQMWYIRGELRFSDHRPVHSLFSVQLDNCDHKEAAASTVKEKDPRHSFYSRARRSGPTNTSAMANGSSSNSSASSCGRVQAEELLETTMKSCLGTSRFRPIHPSPC